jgi:polyvinyl alcohol dehydrogenase (cytochrome)
MKVLFLCAAVSAFAQPDGAALFQKHCASCHRAGSATRAPLPDAMTSMTPEAVLATLESGSMKPQATELSTAERDALAKHLGLGAKTVGQAAGKCAPDTPATSDSSYWNGWGVDRENSRFQPARMAGLDERKVPHLKLKWAFGFPGANSAMAQPVIVGGRIMFGSDNGTVYSVNAKSGCIYWTFKAAATVRTAISVGAINSGHYTLFFGDLKAQVYALDFQTGKQLWRVKLDDHPLARITGAPKLWNEKLYVPVSSVEEVSGGNVGYECCTFRGSLVALEGATGKQIWKSYAIPDPPKLTHRNKSGTQLHGPSGAAIWLSPTLDTARRLIYVGTGNGYSDPATKFTDAVIAFDIDSGAMKWSKQLTPGDGWNFACQSAAGQNCPEDHGSDVDIGTSPILRNNVLLIGQKSGVVYGLDPNNDGKILWQTRIGKGGSLGGIQWGMAADDKTVYSALSDRNPRKWEDEGGLFALDILTGKKLWTTPAVKPACLGKPNCSAAQMAPVTLIPGVVFSGSMDGHLRAYSAKDGRVVWDFDTLREFETVNGVKARGGSLSATGVVVANGMAYVNSGYGALAGMPGNVLLAFAAE